MVVMVVSVDCGGGRCQWMVVVIVVVRVNGSSNGDGGNFVGVVVVVASDVGIRLW